MPAPSSRTNAAFVPQRGLGDTILDLQNCKQMMVIPLNALDAAGACFSQVNPEATPIIITHVILDVQTVATGAGTVSVGTTAVSGATSSANLIDTLDVHSATGLFSNTVNPGAAGKTMQKVAIGAWITASKASGALAGLVGNAYVFYSTVPS